MSLDLEKQLCFYGSYHNNSTNVAIHMICVPAILLTSFLLLSNTLTIIPLPSYLTIPNLPLNLATLGTLGYCGFYILLEPIAGSMVAPLLIAWTAYWNYYTAIVPSPTKEIAAVVFIVSWIAQFVGHGVFEGRAPALLDNLVQALVLAPFFVWMELLFMMGYRPELRGRVDKAVEKEIERYQSARANGTAKNGAAK